MLSMSIIVTEVLITLKFDWHTFTKPLPGYVIVGWVIGLALLALWTVWHFYLQRLLTHTEVRSSADRSAVLPGPSPSDESNGAVRHRKAARSAANSR